MNTSVTVRQRRPLDSCWSQWRPGVARAGASLVVLAAPLVEKARAEPVTLVVPLSTIYPGERIKAENLAVRHARNGGNSRWAGVWATAREEIAGRVAKRTLPRSRAIPLSAVRDAYAFKEGAPVALHFESPGLTITAAGVALQPGVVGQPVIARNLDSGVVVSGAVRPDGSVVVGVPQ